MHTLLQKSFIFVHCLYDDRSLTIRDDIYVCSKADEEPA